MTATAETAMRYLRALCGVTPDRHPGSPGNRAATDFVRAHMERCGWTVEAPEFTCIDWHGGPALLRAGATEFTAYAGPYSLPCDVTAPLIAVSRFEELELVDAADRILLLHGDIASEQLMPKNFVFYNPVHHQRIYALLESRKPAAVLAATERNPELAGSMYPFPLIEDGDFDIPNAYCTDVDGAVLLRHVGEPVTLRFDAERVPSSGCNVIARREGASGKRIVVTAHIDAKKGSPGACDDGTGVVIQMLLAELLANAGLPHTVELAVLNGEDYYAASGQMLYMRGQRWDDMLLNVNIDGVGPDGHATAYSFHDVPADLRNIVATAAARRDRMAEGATWYQGDHMMFVQNGVSALALTTAGMAAVWSEITHTERDTPDIIDPALVTDAAGFVRDVLMLL